MAADPAENNNDVDDPLDLDEEDKQNQEEIIKRENLMNLVLMRNI